jgi:hypothetical protein
VTASPALTAELRAEVLALQDDLRARLAALPERDRGWRDEHARAVKLGRTAASWQQWSENRFTLAAATWVLATVFVRFCEDNGLVKPVWITGPEHRRQEALDAQAHFLRETARTHPDVTDREWLEQAVAHLAELPATAGLVDPRSPIWLIAPSCDAAARLLAFWRERGEDGALLRDLHDDELDTRFLGDLYQDLSEDARDRYALLQTPEFVEEFILDRTLVPALRERPLEGFKMIDPTCGSGHFLLGAFELLLDRWHKHAPGEDDRERVQLALNAVHGVDLNPYAVAIARFRLTVAALKASGMTSLEDAPAFRYHLAAGDSLLHGTDQGELDLGVEHGADQSLAGFGYSTEDVQLLRTILENGRYDCVVGNPPYITVKDKALNTAYRKLYNYCKGTYALTVPFMERFFKLAKSGERAGWVGQITSNSFMKREFGAPLIEKFFPTVDLRLVADTSGAFIPGHGTPTVIIVGRDHSPVASTVRAVLGVRGEPGRPDNPAKAKVWSSIVEHVDEPGWDDEWITVTDLDRDLLATHPWSLTGGGAVELQQAIEQAAQHTLGDVVAEIGFGAVTREDSAYMVGGGILRRLGLPPEHRRPIVEGDVTRDWRIDQPTISAWPYDPHTLEAQDDPGLQRLLWPFRTQLSSRVAYGRTQLERGLQWFEYSMFFSKRYRTPLSIAFAFVATHNHLVLDRGGKVFNRSAPVIKLPEGANEDDHLELLGVLNSSTACFWLKQNSHDKGIRGEGGGFTPSDWERFYEFTGTTLKDFPLPYRLPLERGRVLDSLAQRRAEATAAAVCASATPSRETLNAARTSYDSIRAQMMAQQEELDWEVYRLYGLVDEDLTHGGDDLPELALGERAFEIVLARRIVAGEEETAWFDRHGSTPITELPAHWPPAYRDLVQRRIELIGSHPYIRLMEKPEHKRRWASEPWEKQEERALRGWLLDRLEDRRFWFDAAERPTPRSVANLADDVARDKELVEVLALWEGRPDIPVTQSLQKLLAPEGVPFLAAYRYKESGLRKRAAWEHIWDLQRQEDAGTYRRHVDGAIPVPPKYTSADFARTEYWTHRGKLDGPKERFILYPDAGRHTDPTPVLGWAGWDHAQQALAIAQLIQRGEAEGWDDQRLVPLVAGLAELQPWVQQWHAAPDAFYGGVSPAEFFAEQLDTRAGQVGMTLDQLTAWRPQRSRRRRM